MVLIVSLGIVSSVAGGNTQGYANGEGDVSRFMIPVGISVDDDGNIYIADKADHRIRVINSQGVLVCWFVGLLVCWCVGVLV